MDSINKYVEETKIKSLKIMSVPTLYSICFDYIKDHTEDVVSLVGVPFNPVIIEILNYIFTSEIPLNSSILSVIAESHAADLRKANLTWTSLILSKASITSAIPPLISISKHFPKFITCLKMDQCNLRDNDLLLLRGFSNLKILDLSDNLKLSDRGIMLLVNIATSLVTGGMPHLEDLHLCDLRRVTDKSLKVFTKLSSLNYLDVSNTDITEEVATRYLATKGFERVTNRISSFEIKSAFDIFANPKFYTFIKNLSFEYENGQRPLVSVVIDKVNQPTLHFQKRPSFSEEPIVPGSNKTEPRLPKKRKLNTNDFLAMVENELFNDHGD